MREITRPTKVIKTKANGFDVELYTYITGGEAREIANVFLSGMKFQVDATGQTKSNEMDASLANTAQDKAIEKLVVSVNGDEKDALKSVLNLPKPDFDEVLAEVDKLQAGLSAEKKTN